MGGPGTLYLASTTAFFCGTALPPNNRLVTGTYMGTRYITVPDITAVNLVGCDLDVLGTPLDQVQAVTLVGSTLVAKAIIVTGAVQLSKSSQLSSEPQVLRKAGGGTQGGIDG